MFFQYTSLSALAAITFLTQASTSVAGHVRAHRHHARIVSPFDNKLDIVGRDAGSVEISTGELQMLQSEITTFKGWMNQYVDNANSMDPIAAIAQLKQEFEAFDGWMTDFLSNVMGTGPSTLPPLPTKAPLTATPDPSVIAQLSSSAPAALSSHPIILSSSAAESPVEIPSSPAAIVSPSPTASSIVAPELYKSPTNSSQPATSSASARVSSSAAVISSPAPVPSVPNPVSSPAPTSSVASTSKGGDSGSGSGGSFDAGSSKNLAVYYGQSPATSQQTVAQMCQDPNVDIVILAFVSTFFGAGGYPTINLGSACSGPSPAQTAKGATGMLSCPNVAEDITTCQGLGKKVLLSLGGAVGTTAFSGPEQADKFATQLWNLFGGGNGESKDMRPFGDVKIDGFDIDNEDHSTASYSRFISSLRSAMNADSSKKYYISAAPQCVRPDASIPLDAMQTMDFVFVQFYNNAQAGCDVGQPGFIDSLKAWSGDLTAKGTGPKLYVGAPGCTACAGAGYLAPDEMSKVIKSAQSAGIPNFGGIMLWDGPEAKANNDYLSVVKKALG